MEKKLIKILGIISIIFAAFFVFLGIIFFYQAYLVSMIVEEARRIPMRSVKTSEGEPLETLIPIYLILGTIFVIIGTALLILAIIWIKKAKSI